MKIKYKNTLLTLLVSLGLSGCVGVDPSGKSYNVTVPVSTVNSTFQQSFPQKQNTDYGTLVIDRANILSQAQSDKLKIGTAFTFSNRLIPNGVKGSVSLSSGVRYRADNKALYLASPMVDDITFKNFSLSHYLTPQMRNVIGDVVAQVVANKPIYDLRNMGAAASFIRNVRIRNGNVIVGVGL